jgi:hypothetical protein
MSGTKGILGLAVIAALALAVTTSGAAAGASGGNAVVAKKKCKKHKKQADSAKKKRCKKRKNVPPPSVVRATLTWAPNEEDPSADDADLDLLVFDASGRKAGNGTDAIPASDLSPDATGRSGTETFTDLNAQQHRPLSFAVCYTVGGSVHTPFTVTYVTSDGVTHTDSQRPGESFHYEYPADGVTIPTNECNFA